MFDPCITHQNLVNKIKGLEAILGPFLFDVIYLVQYPV